MTESLLKRKLRVYTEYQHQASLFKWAALAKQQYPELELMYANRNTHGLTIAQARRAKAEGLRAGIPDLFLPVARCLHKGVGEGTMYHGLYIELKSPSVKPKTDRGLIGGMSDAQLIMFPKLRAQGYMVSVYLK